MTWVKVCGVTQAEHVHAAQAAGADAIGIVLVPNSPRAVDEARAARLVAAAEVTAVILTLDLTAEDLIDLARRLGAGGVQPYGRHAEDAASRAAEAGLLALQPITAGETDAVDSLPATVTPLVDHRTPDRLGGTGMTVDWTRLGAVTRRYVLAGGLHPGNVVDALQTTGAWGVDASSGLESAPGIKDVGLIEAFVQEAKRA